MLIEDNGAAMVLLTHALIQARMHGNRLQPELVRLVELFTCGNPEEFWPAFAAFNRGELTADGLRRPAP